MSLSICIIINSNKIKINGTLEALKILKNLIIVKLIYLIRI